MSFSEPGEYTLQAVVDDGSLYVGTYCCWINAVVKVTVKCCAKKAGYVALTTVINIATGLVPSLRHE